MYCKNNSLLGFNTSILSPITLYKSINAMDVHGEYFLSKLYSNIVGKLLLYKWRDDVKIDKPKI